MKKKVKSSEKKRGVLPKRRAKHSQDEISAHSKDRLLQAAYEVFTRKGYHGSTTKMIASVAGVSESLIMRHFQTKHGLFLAVIEGKRIVPSPQDELPYPPQESLVEELIRFSGYLLDHGRKNADTLRILIGQSLLDAEFEAFIRPRMPRPHSEALHVRLERLQKNKKLTPKVDIPALQAAVWNLNISALLFSVLLKGTDEKMATSELRYAIKMLAAGAELQGRETYIS